MKLLILIVYVFIIATISCNNKPGLVPDKEAILSLHNQERKAHIEKNAMLLLGDSTSDFIEINRGVIKKPVYAENIKRFQAYFDAVEFIKWDDATPPVISFSDDSTMATSAVDKIVITRNLQDNSIDTSYYAWLTVYKKIDGKWSMHRIASTNR